MFWPIRALWRVVSRRAGRYSFRSFVLMALLVAVLLTAAGGLTTVGLIVWFSRTLPDPGNLAFRTVTQSTKIYDRTGNALLYDIHGDVRRTVIPLSDVPNRAVLATIAIEDKNFFIHTGVAPRSIARAAFFNIFGNTLGRLVLRRSEGTGGASTLTQQLAKNAILTSERSITRKLKDAFLAYQIEKRFTKEEILELYFNEIPYGSVIYGIEAAAQTFFGKHARDLDLSESALLAAIPRAPTRLSPYGNHTDELLSRQRYALDLMVDQGMIAPDEARAAKEVDVLARIKPKREAITAPHFVLYVKELLTEQYGEDVVERGGLTVQTTLSTDLQSAAEKAVSDNIAKVEEWGGSNAALVALDPRSGEVLAMVGSRDYFNDEIDGQVNVALRPRQPGSSFKPVVYAAAFAKGYTPTTVLFDAVTEFKTDQGAYRPQNYDGKEYGPVTARTALAGSLNIPAVKMLYLVGLPRVLDLADELGYTTLGDRSRFGLALTLGGAEVKLLEHAAALGAFAVEGVRHPPAAILKITDSRGNVLFEKQPDEGRRVIEVEAARQIVDVMQDNDARTFVFGPTSHLLVPGHQVAAKTGTTNDFRDGWALGFTPSLVAGVWTGNNDNAPMKRGADGSRIAAPIWKQFMTEALKNAPSEYFSPPQAVVTGKPILDGVPYPETTVQIDRISGKLATAFTPPELVETRTFRSGSVHDTLFYVRRDDPRGPPPDNPAEDPQFGNWEAAVQRWALEKGLLNQTGGGAPPREYDDVHVPENFPTVKFAAPSEGAAIASREFVVDLAVATPRYSLARTEIRVDGTLVGSFSGTQTSFVVNLPPTVGRGFHALEARVFDWVENSATASININLVAE